MTNDEIRKKLDQACDLLSECYETVGSLPLEEQWQIDLADAVHHAIEALAGLEVEA